MQNEVIETDLLCFRIIRNNRLLICVEYVFPYPDFIVNSKIYRTCFDNIYLYIYIYRT